MPCADVLASMYFDLQTAYTACIYCLAYNAAVEVWCSNIYYSHVKVAE